MRRALPLVLLLVGAAGCAAPPLPSEATAGEAVDERGERGTLVEWSTAQRFDAIGLRVSIDVGRDPNACEVEFGFARHVESFGPSAYFRAELGSRGGSIATSHGWPARLQAGPIDTADLVSPAGAHAAARYRSHGDLQDTIQFIFAGSAIEPWPQAEQGANRLTGDRSVVLRVACERPALLQSVEAGTHVGLWDEQNLSGAAVAVAGDIVRPAVGLGAEARLRLPEESVWGFVHARTGDTADVTLDHPGGSRHWAFPADGEFASFEEGMGSYAFRIDFVQSGTSPGILLGLVGLDLVLGFADVAASGRPA